MPESLMRRLAGRGKLARKFGLRLVESDWPHLEVEHPAGAARVVGEARNDCGPVFLRGQTQNYGGMRPSLFRECEPKEVWGRLQAQAELTERLKAALPNNQRLERPHLPALLQHYGYHTSWLDVVDNLFVATWFATRRRGPSAGMIHGQSQDNEGTHGWVFVLASRVGDAALEVVDLRTQHHPLSARPHVQHGMAVSESNTKLVDLRPFVVATMRVPRTRFLSSGPLFGPSALFPPVTIDHTLRLLSRPSIQRIAPEVEREFGLPEGALGRVSTVY